MKRKRKQREMNLSAKFSQIIKNKMIIIIKKKKLFINKMIKIVKYKLKSKIKS